jgi:hypothetical protein
MDEDELADLLKPPSFLDGPLIDTSGDPMDLADLDFGEGFHYQDGYRIAAEAVLGRAGEFQYDCDRLVYPIVFLYRHRLELHLKELVAWLPVPIENHDLKILWAAVRHLLSSEGVTDRELDMVESRIMELHDLDARATAFRYAYKRKKDGGGRSVSGTINIRLFAERMESLCGTLDGWDTMIHEQRGWRAEMEAEARYYADQEAEYYRDEGYYNYNNEL